MMHHFFLLATLAKALFLILFPAMGLPQGCR